MKELEVRFVQGDKTTRLAALLVKSGSTATRSFEQARSSPGVHLLLTGERNYHVVLAGAPAPEARAALDAALGRKVLVEFRGRRPVRQRLAAIAGQGPEDRSQPAAPAAAALDLTAGIHGAAPLFLLPTPA